jgi:hypothetical protein
VIVFDAELSCSFTREQGTIVPVQDMKAYGRREVQLRLFLAGIA